MNAPAKPQLLSINDHARVNDWLTRIAEETLILSHILQGAYGNQLGDKALDVHRRIQTLRATIDGRFYRQPRAATAELKDLPASAFRHAKLSAQAVPMEPTEPEAPHEGLLSGAFQNEAAEGL